VDVEAYNTELKDDEGFIGDRANKGAFRRFLDEWRKPLQEIGEDPFGDVETTELTKKKLDALLAGGDPEAAASYKVRSKASPKSFPWFSSGFSNLKDGKTLKGSWSGAASADAGSGNLRLEEPPSF
jgi:hypothetical protein